MKTNVSRWTTALALTVGGVMLATSAIAQSGAGSPPAGGSADTSKSGAPQADTSSKSPGAAAATTGTMAGETKSDAMKTGAQGAGGEQVKAVQQALKDRGHDPGEVDGAMGPKTKAALRDFQQKEGLKATGTADAETMAKLTASASTPAASPSGTSSNSGTSKDSTSPGAKQTK